MNKLSTKYPLLFDKKLAVKIGLNESIVLQQIDYWVNVNRKKNNNFYNNRYWTYNTVRQWQEEFPFWSKETVKRVLNNLRKLNLIITDNFNKSKLDRTLWYTINYEELEKYIDEEDNNMSDFNDKDINDSNDTDTIHAIDQNDIAQESKKPQAIPEITTETSSNISSQSVNHRVTQVVTKETDRKINTNKIKESYKKIIDKCELYAIDSSYREAVKHAIKLLVIDTERASTVKIGNRFIPSAIVKKDLNKLSFSVVDHAINKFRQISRITRIKNTIAYLKTCIYNAISEMQLDIETELLFEGII